MENLTLPEPAASLWAAKRSIVHAIPPEMFGRIIPPHLGGGTILAARWKHRISTDICSSRRWRGVATDGNRPGWGAPSAAPSSGADSWVSTEVD